MYCISAFRLNLLSYGLHRDIYAESWLSCHCLLRFFSPIFQFRHDFLMNFHPIQYYCRKNLFLIIKAIVALSQASVAVLEDFSNCLWMHLYSRKEFSLHLEDKSPRSIPSWMPSLTQALWRCSGNGLTQLSHRLTALAPRAGGNHEYKDLCSTLYCAPVIPFPLDRELFFLSLTPWTSPIWTVAHENATTQPLGHPETVYVIPLL